jgi:hypothetical protein
MRSTGLARSVMAAPNGFASAGLPIEDVYYVFVGEIDKESRATMLSLYFPKINCYCDDFFFCILAEACCLA